MGTSPDPPLLNPFADLIGLHFSECVQGESVCHLALTPALLNPYGVAHGAVLYALADTGMGKALVSLLDAGQRCATIEIKISYFQAVRGGELRCEARVLQKGSRVAFLQAAIYQGERPVAQATGTFAIFAARADR